MVRMAARKLTDAELIRGILQLRDDETFSTARNLALYFNMAPSSLHRRLAEMVDDGYLAKGGTGYRLRPRALDLVGGFAEGYLKVFWQHDRDGLYLSSVVD